MLSSFYKLCCGILGCHLSGGTIFPSFRYGFYPRGRAGFWQKIPTGLCSLIFLLSCCCSLTFWLPSSHPIPVRLLCPAPCRGYWLCWYSRPSLSTLLCKPPLFGVLRGSPHGKQGQKSAADLRKVPFLPSSAQSCGQKPKRISHRYRQLRIK